MSQKDLKKFVAKELKKTHDKVITGDGYVFAQGDFPVLLVAHMDTVHKELPKTISYDKKADSLSSPQGIGGDDRCGVYMVLEVLKAFNCSVLFCEDEECGGIGATKFTNTELAKTLEFNYMIEFDRKGSNDAVFYDCANDEFEEFITEEFYKTAWGSFSDISVLAPFFECAAVNLSCGYYNAHTTNEYVVISEMQESIFQACKILAKTTENDRFAYVDGYKGTAWDDWGYYDDKIFLIEWYNTKTKQDDWVEIEAISKAEAIGKFCMEHPDIPYNSFYVTEFDYNSSVVR
jgi:di/tripeptidase